MLQKRYYKSEEIEQGLIYACANFDAGSFIPILMAKNVVTEFPNKVRFYRYFKYMLNCAKCSTVGLLSLRKEKYNWEEDKEMRYYNFYDEIHKGSRLSFRYKVSNNLIFIDIMPF